MELLAANIAVEDLGFPGVTIHVPEEVYVTVVWLSISNEDGTEISAALLDTVVKSAKEFES